jgi:lysophospholipase L1-like esterase
VALDGNIVEVRAVDTNSTTQTFNAPPGDGPHELSVTKLNEAMDGELIFGGFTAADGGSLLPTRTLNGRRIEFIGDSITCGYGNLGTITSKMLSDSTDASKNSLRSCQDFLGKEVYEVSSAYFAWGPQVARSFDADWRLICWSGKGVYRNADNTSTDLMPDVYGRSVATDASTSYDLSSWIPQAVVINLGTNDFGSVAQVNAGGPPDLGKFKTNYIKLVKQVRKAYPNAWILLATGPMLSDFFPTSFKALTTMRATLNQIIAQLNDDRVQFFEFPLNIASDADATGCEWHPDVDQDTGMATKLEVALQQYVGWKQ